MKIEKTREFPARLTVELSNNCNLRCTMCPRQLIGKMSGLMEVDLFNKIISEVRNHLPVTLVPFFRGESMLHPRFLEMIKMAKEAGLSPIQLTTNATLLDEEISEALIAIELDFISFSLDVLGKESYEAIRIGGDYEQVKANIEKFLEIRANKCTSKPEVQISAVETESNKDKMVEFLDYWSEKVDRVRIYPEHSTNGNFGSLKDKYSFPQFERRLPCKKVFSEMVIYWNGDIAVCNHDWDRKEYIGNVREETIKEIWNGMKYNDIRQRHIAGDLGNDPTCGGCDHWMMCYMPDGIVGKLFKREKI